MLTLIFALDHMIGGMFLLSGGNLFILILGLQARILELHEHYDFVFDFSALLC